MLQAADAFPMNLGFLGKGNASLLDALHEQINACVIGLELHEDWGTTPAAISNCLDMADSADVQVVIHSDTLNESGFVENTIAATQGRTLCAFHPEGAGGGHAPDVLRTWQTARKLNQQRGRVADPHSAATDGYDNFRVKRHITKYTINPAIAPDIYTKLAWSRLGNGPS